MIMVAEEAAWHLSAGHFYFHTSLFQSRDEPQMRGAGTEGFE